MPHLKLILGKLGLVTKLALTNIRTTIEIIMVAALLVAGWAYNRKEAELERATSAHATLAANLQAQITMQDNTIKILRRRPDGAVSSTTVYVPSEGGSTVTHSTSTQGTSIVNPPAGNPVDMGNGMIVYIKTKGLCSKPGFGFDYDGVKLRPYLDMKLAYFNRLSAAVGGSTGGIGVTVSRHLDDVLFFHPQNVELFLHYRVLKMGSGAQGSVGLRSNF